MLRLNAAERAKAVAHIDHLQSVAMLSAILGSQRAVAVNIEIMRTFVRVRALAMRHDTFGRNTN